jgi:hypothetical protein
MNFFAVDASGQPVPLKRGTAWGYWIASLVALAAGIVVYSLGHAPAHADIVRVELVGANQPHALPADLTKSLRLDLVLILGYGLALLFAMQLAHAVFWSPRARAIARGARWLALAAVCADLVEDLCLHEAGNNHSRWLDFATAAAVIKFSSLAVAGAVGVAALFTTAHRLLRNGAKGLRKRKKVGTWPAIAVTDDDPQPSGGAPPTDPAPNGADRWRRGYNVPDVDTKSGSSVGICLSGGGVRSASVALGALQQLRKQLEKARYLVSVSGGGYTAGAFQLAMTDADARPDPHDPALHDADQVFVPGSVEEDWVRRHADYLADTPAKIVVALGVVARVLILSLVFLFGPAIVLGVLAGRALEKVPVTRWNVDELHPWAPHLRYPPVRTGTWYALGVLVGLALAAYFVMLSRSSKSADRTRGLAKGLTALALLVAVLVLLLPSLVYVAALILRPKTGPVAVGGSIGTVLLSYGVTLTGVLRSKKIREQVTGLFKRGGAIGAAPGGAVQLVFVALTLLLLGAGWLLLFGGVASVADTRGAFWAAVGGGAFLLLSALVLDQTSLSLHPFYRRQLAGAFASRRVVRAGNPVAEGYDFHELTALSRYGKRPVRRDGPDNFPEVIFAATANLTGEARAPLNGVPYTLSAEWVGGPDIGYMRTAQLEQTLEHEHATKVNRDLTVEAAVAISGAAFASAMGRANRWYGTLLAVTGMRLGTWLPNPVFVREWSDAARPHDDADHDADQWALPTMPRLRRLPYLVREVFGIHRFSDRLLQVTDGGHYDNLGLVELFRRRCTEIYCIDASGDSPPTATTLEQALTIARLELGVTINLEDKLWNLVPGSGTPLEPHDPFASLNARLTKAAAVAIHFRYPEESGLPDTKLDGILIFAKTLLVSDMSYEVLSYAARNAIFPRDSTGDQFFDDGKFSAYRGIGQEIGKRAADLAQHLSEYEAARARKAQSRADGAPETVVIVVEIDES